jgi:hypothetical protein
MLKEHLFLAVPYLFFNIVTYLINALPVSSSVNTVQHATVELVVFRVSGSWRRSGNVTQHR